MDVLPSSQIEHLMCIDDAIWLLPVGYALQVTMFDGTDEEIAHIFPSAHSRYRKSHYKRNKEFLIRLLSDFASHMIQKPRIEHLFSLPENWTDIRMKSATTRSATPNRETVQVESKKERATTAPFSPSPSSGRSCRLCGNLTFSNVRDQRLHFQSSQHIANLHQQRGSGTSNSNSDGSESSDSSNEDSATVDEGPVKLLIFEVPSVKLCFNLHECLFRPDQDPLLTLKQWQTSKKVWTFLFLSGGRFAYAVYDHEHYIKRSKPIDHRSLQRYTVRKKQGGSQRSRDAQGNAPKSAGASLRRHNEKMLTEVINHHVYLMN